MSTSGTISTTTFNTRKVIDLAFRRCRLQPQRITSEMQEYAKDSLHLILSNIANNKPPSWCIEKVILPMYSGQPDITLPAGTVGVLNLNYRTLLRAEGTETTTSNSLKVDFGTGITVSTFGILWATTSSVLTLAVSDDDITWETVGTVDEAAQSGEWVWYDISRVSAHRYFRVTSVGSLIASDVFLGNTPVEIPLGTLNRDQYVQQSNKVFQNRPNSYWFQRDIPQPVLHLWPAPNDAASEAQLILWRHRHIMDVGTLRQDIEVPQRWLDAIVYSLAASVAEQTPEVEAGLIPSLEAKAQFYMDAARAGDNDGSPTYYQPAISPYTR